MFDPFHQQPARSKAAGALFQTAFSVGGMLLPLVAFLVPHWREFVIVLIAMTAGCGSLVMATVPESPKWLLDKGRREEATALAEHIKVYNQGR